MRRKPVGLWLGRVGSGCVRAGEEALGGGAMDRRSRQSRIMQSRGSGLVAASRSAPASTSPQLRRRGRRRDRRLQRAVRGAARHGPRRRHAVHRVRFVAGRRCAAAADDPMHVRYRAQFEQRFRPRRAAAERVLHEPPPDPRIRAQPGKAGRAVPRQRRALQSVLATLQPTVLLPPNVKALMSGHVHLFEVVSFSTPQPAQFVVRQWRRLDRHAAAAAAACRTSCLRPAPVMASLCGDRTGSAS